MSETINSATANGTTHDSAGIGESGAERPTNHDDAGTLLVVMNGALVGVSSAYAVSHSLVVTAIAATLAGASAAALLAAQWTRRRG